MYAKTPQRLSYQTESAHLESPTARQISHSSQQHVVSIGENIDELIAQIKDETGLLTSHLQPLEKLASQINCIIAIRPVEKIASQLIMAGHPTKNLHIKGKSASWGPQAGMICVDQKFSKLEASDKKTIDQFNISIKQCLQLNHASNVQLSISKTHLSYLLNQGLVTLGLEINDRISIEAKAPSGENYTFLGVRDQNDYYRIFYNEAPIEVLAPNSHMPPFTADYDLLLVAPHISEIGPQDRLLIPDVAYPIFGRKLKQYQSLPNNLEMIRDYYSEQHFYSKVDPDMGNVSRRVRNIVPLINSALNCRPKFEVVHHGADNSNPATDMTSNYPATFFLPKPLATFKKISIIHDKTELIQMVQAIKDAYYHPPLNPLWEKEITEIKRSCYISGREFLRNRSASFSV